MSINTVVLTGRLCADPELKHSGKGTAIANFRLAVDRNGKDEGADFFTCVAFEKTAELVCKFCDKGSLVGVEGRLQARQWETDSGDKRTAVEVVANRVQFMESRSEAEARRGGVPRGRDAAAAQQPDDPFGSE